MKTNLCDVYGFLRESNEELENLNSGAGETEAAAFVCVSELIKRICLDRQKTGNAGCMTHL